MKPLILFDYGGVIAQKNSIEAEMALCNLIGSSNDVVWKLLSEKSQYGSLYREGSITTKDFWERVFEEAKTPNEKIPDYQYLASLWLSNYVPNPEMITLLSELKKTCYIGLLTNIDEGRSCELEKTAVYKMIDFYFPSFQFKATKYNPLLWNSINKYIVDKMIYPSNILYIDDREAHVTSAKSVGWDSHLFTDVVELTTHLKKRKFL